MVAVWRSVTTQAICDGRKKRAIGFVKRVPSISACDVPDSHWKIARNKWDGFGQRGPNDPTNDNDNRVGANDYDYRKRYTDNFG